MKEDRFRWVVEGLVTGLIGYLTVVVLFLVLNLLSGRPVFYTAELLGSALFFGSGDPGRSGGAAAPVLAYNGVHMLASLLIGLAAAWLVYQTERYRSLWYPVFFIFLAGFIFSVAVMGVLAAETTHLLSWTTIVLANVVAGVAAGGYLWRRHSRLLDRAGAEL